MKATMSSPITKTATSTMKTTTFMLTNKRLAQLEREMKEWRAEREVWKEEKSTFLKLWNDEKDAMKVEIKILKEEKERREWEKEQWRKEKEDMNAQIEALRVSIASLTPEEGEIKVETKEALKEEITKALTASIEDKLEATKDGWVEVVKKNIKKEAREEAQKDEVLIVHTTIEEEKMRQARRLNVRVTGIKEQEGSTPASDGKALCAKIGYKEEEVPFSKAWRAGKDPKKRALILRGIPNLFSLKEGHLERARRPPDLF